MNYKTLPVKYPIITSWTWHANLLSILGNYEETNGWIFSNYIMLHGHPDRGNHGKLFIDFNPINPFLTCPWVEYQILNRKTIGQLYNNISDFIIHSIANNQYIYGVVNENILLNYQNKHKFLHEIFVYGYDAHKNIARAADFTFKNKYSFETVNLDKLSQAFSDVNDREDYLLIGMGGIVLLEYTRKKGYNFQPALAKKFFELYIEPYYMYNDINIVSDIDPHIAYGTDVYGVMIEHINTTFEKRLRWDQRAFHNLFDHKSLMVKRIKFMIENKCLDMPLYILNNFEDIERQALMLTNICIKSNIKKVWESETAEHLKKVLFDIKEKETALFNQVIERIVV